MSRFFINARSCHGDRHPDGDHRCGRHDGAPIAQFPNIVPPEIQVSTTYTGADALTVEQSVATPSSSRCPAWTT